MEHGGQQKSTCRQKGMYLRMEDNKKEGWDMGDLRVGMKGLGHEG